MTDTSASAAAPAAPAAAPAAPAEQTPAAPAAPATAEIDWKAMARKHEDAAKAEKKRADTNESAAQRLAALENANKTDLEKAQLRADEAERKATETEQRALRAEVAAAKSVPVDLLSGSTKDEIEAAADRLIEFRGAKTPVGVHLPNQDKSPQGTPSGLAETARKLFGGGN